MLSDCPVKRHLIIAPTQKEKKNRFWGEGRGRFLSYHRQRLVLGQTQNHGKTLGYAGVQPNYHINKNAFFGQNGQKKTREKCFFSEFLTMYGFKTIRIRFKIW
jgi:hypothetical protein